MEENGSDKGESRMKTVDPGVGAGESIRRGRGAGSGADGSNICVTPRGLFPPSLSLKGLTFMGVS